MLSFLPSLDRLKQLLPEDAVTSVALLAVVCGAGAALYSVTHPSPAARQKLYRPSSTLPVLGNTLDMLVHNEHIYDWIKENCEKAGGRTWCLTFIGRPPIYVVHTPETIEDVEKTHFSNFEKGERQVFVLGDMLGRGIFLADGESWASQRKVASRLFTHRALRDSMTSTVREHTLDLLPLLSRSANDQKPLDLFWLISRFTMETFAELAFGFKIDSEADGEHPFQTAFDAVQIASLKRQLYPNWLVHIRRYFGIGYEGELARSLRTIDESFMEIIHQCLSEHAGDKATDKVSPPTNGGKNNLIRLYLEHAVSDSEAEVDPKTLRDFAIGFLMAGRDTTALALSWFFYCITQHPEVERVIVEEMKGKCPHLFDGEEFATPSMEEVQQLVYLEAAIKETLRLYPSLAQNARTAACDTVLSDGVLIPKDAYVLLPTYTLGRLESSWGPDALEFKPERWIDPTTGKLISVSSFKYNVFHAGPRTCLGMNLALVESKIVAASILSRFRISLEPGVTVTYRRSISFMMRDPFMVKVELRA